MAKVKQLTYDELVAERERIEYLICKTSSMFAKRDMKKYLFKINAEIRARQPKGTNS